MLSSEETSLLVRAIIVSGVGAALGAKIFAECGAEAWRVRLRALDAEVFDLARRGRVSFHDPACTTLRDCIRGVIEDSHGGGLAETLRAVEHGAPPPSPSRIVESRLRGWDEALSRVACGDARAELAGVRERLRTEVRPLATLGALPRAWIASGGDRLRPLVAGCRRFAVRSAGAVAAFARFATRMPTTA